MQDNQDIFDRLMSVKCLNFAKPFYIAHKEMLLYLLFGGLTTFISILSFTVVYEVLHINEHISNIVSWVLAVTFAFFTNRTWVFKSTSEFEPSFFGQIVSFYAGRLLTLGVEEIIVFVFISKMGCEAFFVKVLAQIVVLILNFLVSKFWVFKKRATTEY